MPNDAEEVADVIARHLLDAVDAVPEHPDVETVRARAVEELVRAGDGARRLGAQARAAGDYAAAAERATDPATAAGYLLRASEAALLAARYEDAVELADQAGLRYEAAGDVRAAARAEAAAGRALGQAGRFDEAGVRTAHALETLRIEPDVDTVAALRALAVDEVFAGGPDAERLTREAVELAEELEAPPAVQAEVLLARGTMHAFAGHHTRAVAYYREATRLAEVAQDSVTATKALNNLVVSLYSTDAAGANEAAMDVLARTIRLGDRYGVGVALINVVETLLQLGRWDEAAAQIEGLADTVGDLEHFLLAGGELAALRGDVPRARELAARLDASGSQNAEAAAAAADILAHAADAAGQPAEAVLHARTVLGFREALGLHQFTMCWAWPVGARAAHRMGDLAGEQHLVDLLDAYRRTQLPPMLRVERDLAAARLAADRDGGTDRLEAAVAMLREASTPFHLGHGLVDLAEHLVAAGRDGDAAPLLTEATTIAEGLGAAPLATRAAAVAGSVRTTLAVE
jgi:tetratricopeptide (TPR) repeat protein